MQYRTSNSRASSASHQLDLFLWLADQDQRQRMCWPARRLARQLGLTPTAAALVAAELFAEARP
ncbi:hypothetical protein [Desertibaculum subflavum]|uniref:hypothetical protein n=1 Tax=Desertibaculum subflavum TaxID=2268458 RepID=UPI000E661704